MRQSSDWPFQFPSTRHGRGERDRNCYLVVVNKVLIASHIDEFKYLVDQHQPLLLLASAPQGTASRRRRGQDRCRVTATRGEAHSHTCKARLLPPIGARAPSRRLAAAHPQWLSSAFEGLCSVLVSSHPVVRDRRHCHRDAELLMPAAPVARSP